jgi:hypothetical protein
MAFTFVFLSERLEIISLVCYGYKIADTEGYLLVSIYFNFYFSVLFMTMDLLEITDAKGKMHKHFLDDGSGEACVIVM